MCYCRRRTRRVFCLFLYFPIIFIIRAVAFISFYLGVVTVTDFFLAGRMAVTESKWGRKGLLLLSLFVNLGLLCYFKLY